MPEATATLNLVSTSKMGCREREGTCVTAAAILGSRRSGRFAAWLTLCLAVGGCATNQPLREASLAWDGHTVLQRPDVCARWYAWSDSLIWSEMRNPNTSVKSRQELNDRINAVVGRQLGGADEVLSSCWKVAYENHQGLSLPKDPAGGPLLQAPAYDLLLAEFDDQGERTDVSVASVDFRKSEVALIESQLERILSEEEHKGGGLNLIIFTHGWHGSAAATNDYSLWFKAILEQTTDFEAHSRLAVCRESRNRLNEVADPSAREDSSARRQSYACPQGPARTDQPSDRRTVGIEIAWRGDSEDLPYLDMANFWDRKRAAQTVAQGGVHDLMARLHKFYIAHSCHGKTTIRTPSAESCDVVHLLTVGHSFGALIDWHVLNDDLSTGLLGDSERRAYGFGDLTVFLNPAFEGERESTLFAAATHRSDPYPTTSSRTSAEGSARPGAWPTVAQMPTLVTLQSLGDWATHYAFPAARFFKGLFENTPGAHEHTRSVEAVGWIGGYQTHALHSPDKPVVAGKDGCDLTGVHPAWFCPFDVEHEDSVAHPLILNWHSATDLPDYLPLWTIAVDKSIMRDHDDISNPAIVRFIAQLFRAAYEQEELIHEARVASERAPAAEVGRR